MKRKFILDWLLLAAFAAALTGVVCTVMHHALTILPRESVSVLLTVVGIVMLCVIWLLAAQIAGYLYRKADRVYREEAGEDAQKAE